MYGNLVGQDQVSSSLELVARKNYVHLVDKMNEMGKVDFVFKNPDGNTALHLAAMHGHEKLTAKLITEFQAGKNKMSQTISKSFFSLTFLQSLLTALKNKIFNFFLFFPCVSVYFWKIFCFLSIYSFF